MIAPGQRQKGPLKETWESMNRMKIIESIGEEELEKKAAMAGIDLKKTLEAYAAIPKLKTKSSWWKY